MSGSVMAVRQKTMQWLATRDGKIAISAGLHVAALLLIVNAWWMGAHRMKRAGTKHGSDVMMTFSPNREIHASAAQKPVRQIKRPKKVTEAVVKTPVVQDVPVASGVEAKGDGTFSIAFVQAFPSRKPDLSGVGNTADIFLDLEIDDTGHIARMHARKGISRDVDEMVVATVEQWLFHPATKNGKPITSEQELHFHFDRRRNPAGCGWECITLEAD